MRATLSPLCYFVGCGVFLFLVGAAQAMEPTTVPATEPAATAPSTEPSTWMRPAMEPVLRSNEDWSVLKNKGAESPADFFDPIKYVPLSDEGDIWASFGGSARMRFEWWQNYKLNQDQNETFDLWRMQLHADLHVSPYLRVYIEGVTSGVLTDNSQLFVDGTRNPDLLQAFADLILPLEDQDVKVTLRGGRQLLSFGRERMVSPNAWSNDLNTFDGFSAIIETGGWTITPFWTWPVINKKYEFDESDQDEKFFGLYVTGPSILGIQGMKNDFYYLGVEVDNVYGYYDQKVHTVGSRVFGNVQGTGWDYDLEGAYQFGELWGEDINSFMWALEIGYQFAEVELQPRPFIGFDYASGRGDSSDTFWQLFPDTHGSFGNMDVLGRQNLIDAHLGVNLTPVKDLTLTAAQHFLWKAQRADGVYTADGYWIFGTFSSDQNTIGSEFDITAKYVFNEHLSGLLGYSHFFLDSIDGSRYYYSPRAADDSDFFYAQLDFRF